VSKHSDAVSFSHCLMLPNPGKLVSVFFLTCTKNTELTRAHFARTFSFAHTQKRESFHSRVEVQAE
jgi:hypothetical protein